MEHLQDKVVVVTGAGRGIGREHALLMARHGARVVVNDLGGAPDGSGSEPGPAEVVAEEIRSSGGEAVANSDDVSDPDGAAAIVQSGIDAFGRIDGLVNNAGVLRDGVIVNLSESDWDIVVKVNLKGTFLVTRAAARHWRERSKSGEEVMAAVVNTSSESGVFGNPGQANYASAKAAIASFTQIASKELGRYGVRTNAILPQARTRLTEGAFGDALAPKEGEFDRFDPANVSPMVTYLISDGCALSGEVFLVGGSRVQRIRPWEKDPDWKLMTDGRWDVDGLATAAEAAGIPQGNAWTANPRKAGASS